MIKSCLRVVLVWTVAVLVSTSGRAADDAERPKRLLLIGQGPDNHPWSTHEYMAGIRILADCLSPVDNLQIILANANEPWSEGPEMVDGADGVVLFVSQGARWLQQDEARLHAFQQLAERGGGLAALHWGIGCKEAEYIEKYVELFGGCHGGPDRKYAVTTVQADVAAPEHPVMQGVSPFGARDEFYYQLKFAKPEGSITPLLRVPIEGESHAVAWAWERPDGGRSFGFSGLHFHDNWQLEPYRRMITQAVLWTVQQPIPDDLPLDYKPTDLDYPRPKPE